MESLELLKFVTEQNLVTALLLFAVIWLAKNNNKKEQQISTISKEAIELATLAENRGKLIEQNQERNKTLLEGIIKNLETSLNDRVVKETMILSKLDELLINHSKESKEAILSGVQNIINQINTTK